MKHPGITFLFGILPGLLCTNSLRAQSDEEMARIFEWTFSIDAPDTSFIQMEGASGWEEPATQAKIICMATPTPYERMALDLQALSSEDGQKVLEKRTLDIGGLPGTLVLLEFEPVAGEDTGIMYSVMYARPLDGASLVVNAQYPKSQHERLYSKMIDAFATARKTD